MNEAAIVAGRLDETGGELLRWLLAMNLWAAALLAAVVLADIVLARRIGAGWRLALYAVILIRLVLPVDWAAPLGVLSTSGAGSGQPVIVEASPAASASAAMSAPAAMGNAASAPGANSGGPGASTSWRALVPIVWGVGTVLLLTLMLAQQAGIARIVRASRRAMDLAGDGPPVRIHPTAGPLLAGVLHPCIIIPEYLAAPGKPGALACVLRHERAHFARGDHVTATGINVVLAALWPIAALWVAAARVRGLMEQAADERAIGAGREGGGAGRDQRAAYADVLLELLQRRRVVAWRQGLVERGVGGAVGFGQGVKSRLRALRFQKRWGVLAQAAVVLGIGGAIIGAAGRPAPVVQPEGKVGPAEVPGRPGAVVRMVLLATWPEHPGLDFGVMRQEQERPEERRAPDVPASIRTISDEEARAIIEESRSKPWRETVLAEPQLALPSGGASTVRVPRGSSGNPHTNGFVFGVRLLEADREAARVRVNFREMERGHSVAWHDTREVAIPAGRTGYALVTGEKGAPRRLLLLSAEWRERVPLLGGFNPMDPEHYPVVSAHLSVHGLNREIKFEQLMPDVDAQRIAPHRAGFLWARSIPAERRDSLFLAMQKPGTGARLFSPMLMVRPGEAGAIGPDSVDKEGLSTGGHRISAHARLEGEDIWLTIRHETRDEAGVLVERGILLDVPAPPDRIVTFMHGPVDGRWYVVSAQATLVRSRDDYPFATAAPLEPPPAPQRP